MRRFWRTCCRAGKMCAMGSDGEGRGWPHQHEYTPTSRRVKKQNCHLSWQQYDRVGVYRSDSEAPTVKLLTTLPHLTPKRIIEPKGRHSYIIPAPIRGTSRCSPPV